MEEYRKALTVWYNQSKRELPWRGTTDPYKIWVSEIILQQTRVQQGMDYYHAFVRTFPDVASLAAAPEDEVLKIWQGLGYYSRARNMHHAAREIMAKYDGRFPEDYAAIRQLKGIGDYTAAAIASICFGEPFAVVDGNVYRVLARLFGVQTSIDSGTGKKEFRLLAERLLDRSNPGLFNQAMMEFGALQCLPARPLCDTCPLAGKCFALAGHMVDILPVKAAKNKIKARFLNYLYLHQGGDIFFEKRVQADIWKNMYQLPLIETPTQLTPEALIAGELWQDLFADHPVVLEAVTQERIHLLTHQRLHIRFFVLALPDETAQPPGLIRLSKSRVEDYPVPKPIELFLYEMAH